MKVILLAGGLGTRLSEETEYMPKPMVEVGGMPILWHIMKEYSHYGFNDFIICAGYKQHMVKKWFGDYYYYTSDVCFDFADGGRMDVLEERSEGWKVTVVDTGLDTMTGGRLGRVKKYVGDQPFMLTYGDGVCDVDLGELLAFHRSHGKMATLTAVVQKETKGRLDIAVDKSVRSFREKRARDGFAINAGYMVLEPGVFDYIEGDGSVLETDVLERLAAEGQLMSYQHEGFWQCMDNLHEKRILEKLWADGEAPWKKWG